MKKTLKALVALMFFVLLSVIFLGVAEQNSVAEASVQKQDRTTSKPDFASNEIILKLKEGSTISLASDDSSSVRGLDAINRKLSVEYCCRILPNVYKLAFPAGISLKSVIAEYRNHPLVEYAEPNYVYRTCFTPNDPYYSKQWAHQAIGSEAAWDTEKGSSSVLVAVIDTGVDYNHSDLKTNYVALGYDWANGDTDPMDDHGHGTHCAGIIASTLNNGIGVAGVAQVRIMAEKGLTSGGWGYVEWLGPAIRHAADCGAKVISMSWGAYENSTTIYEAIKYAYAKGVVLVAAAGNENTTDKLYPAGYDEVIAVAATTISDEKAWFSNYGNWVDISAPGYQIYSTMPGNSYAYMSGTSMACPHVAAAAALIKSRFPTLTRDNIVYQLKWTSDDLGGFGLDEIFGYGRINTRWGVAVFKPPKNLRIWGCQAAGFVKPQVLQKINVSVLNNGINSMSGIYVDLIVDGTTISTKTISYLSSLQYAVVSFSWTPTAEKWYNVTTYVRLKSGEAVTPDNTLSKSVLSRASNIVFVPADFSTIQEAVDTVPSGAVVQISPGTYCESILLSRFNVTLKGESPYTTVIDSGPDIGISSFEDCLTIAGLKVKSSLCSVFFYFSNNNTIVDSILTAYGRSSGNGVFAPGSSFNHFEHNLVCDSWRGIFFFAGSTGNTIVRNTISNTNISLWMWDGDGSTVRDNVLSDNINCVSLWCANCTFTGNTIRNNYYGIYLADGNLQGNTFYHNNFIQNTNQVYMGIPDNLNGTVWDNGQEGNYWSDYTGTDLNGDGIGDIPYTSNVTDNYPLMNPKQAKYDRTATNVQFTLPYEATAIYPSWKINVTVSAANNGLASDSFYLIVYYNSTEGAGKLVTNVQPGGGIEAPVCWNTAGISAGTRGLNYIVSAGADTNGDPNTADNKVSDGMLRVRYPGDSDDDGDVDIFDAVRMGTAYGSVYGDGKYTWQVDFNGDGVINILDQTILNANYGHQG